MFNNWFNKKQFDALITIIVIIAMSGCNLAQDSTPVPVVPPTQPYIQLAQATNPLPTQTRDVRAIPTITSPPPSPTPEPTVSPYRCGVAQEGEHIQHQVVANLDYRTKVITTSQMITIRNDSEVAWNDLVLAVEPNAFDGTFILDSLLLNGADIPHNLERKRLTVFLSSPMNPACELTLSLRHTIAVPPKATGINSFKGYFSFAERQMNLAHWLPTLAPRIDNQWIVHTTQAIGEQHILEQADWDITFNVSNVNGLVIAMPGTVTQPADNQWQSTLTSARDFTMSISPNFRVRSATSRDGVQVELYHFGDTVRAVDTGGTVDGAPHALQLAVESLEQYTALFGDYPYERMIVVQGDFPDGMEFTGLVFVSTNWFYLYEGGVQNFLSAITVHEVAHQWWYATVGNDAALDPWLDEALATYSEYIYYEEFHPDLKNWWWSWRIGWYDPQGDVGSSVYDFDNGRAYINAVYLRGAQLLHNLRDDIGTQAFFDWLAAYAAAADGQIASSELLWSLLTDEQRAATQATRDAFFSGGINGDS